MNALIEEFDAGVLTLKINRPKARNAMTSELIEALTIAVKAASEKPEVRCVVLTSVGGTFCIGADANDIPVQKDAHLPSRGTRIRDLRQAGELSRLLYTIAKPTIAVMPGAAAGGGLSIALACDMRFCLDTATLSTAFSMIGGSGDFGISYFLPRLVGGAKARELLFTSRRISGQQANEMGLVNAVASADHFDERARDFVSEIASLPTIALGHIKQNLIAAELSSFEQVLDLEARNMVLSMETEDHRSAVKAFLNKQKPAFSGR